MTTRTYVEMLLVMRSIFFKLTLLITLYLGVDAAVSMSGVEALAFFQIGIALYAMLFSARVTKLARAQKELYGEELVGKTFMKMFRMLQIQTVFWAGTFLYHAYQLV